VRLRHVGLDTLGNGARLWVCITRSVDGHQAFGEALPIGSILRGAIAQVPGRRFIEGTHEAGRAADNQAIVWKLLAFGHQGIGADETIAADSGAVQKRRAHPNETVFANRAAMQDCVMADGAVLTDGQRKAQVGVQQRSILHVGAGANEYFFDVAAQDGAEPDRHTGFEPHLADDVRARRDPEPAVAWENGRDAIECVNRHFRLNSNGKRIVLDMRVAFQFDFLQLVALRRSDAHLCYPRQPHNGYWAIGTMSIANPATYEHCDRKSPRYFGKSAR
jgi:hypothetical protein